MNIIRIIIAVTVIVILLALLFKGEIGEFIVGGYLAILAIIGIYALSFGIVSAIVWGICKCAKLIGLTSIGSWTIAFSWPLAGLVWLIYLLLHGTFSINIKDNS